MKFVIILFWLINYHIIYLLALEKIKWKWSDEKNTKREGEKEGKKGVVAFKMKIKKKNIAHKHTQIHI